MSVSTDRAPSLLEGSASKRLAAFSAPLVAANLLQYVYQFVDMGVVGNVVGEAGLVAVSNASTIVFIISSIAIGLMSGCTVAVGNRVGARDEQGQRFAFAASLGVALLGAAAITLAGTALAHPIFSLMGVPGTSLAQALDALRSSPWARSGSSSSTPRARSCGRRETQSALSPSWPSPLQRT